jgi:hypothetical protein
LSLRTRVPAITSSVIVLSPISALISACQSTPACVFSGRGLPSVSRSATMVPSKVFTP